MEGFRESWKGEGRDEGRKGRREEGKQAAEMTGKWKRSNIYGKSTKNIERRKKNGKQNKRKQYKVF